MLGAIAGDIIGSPYEGAPCRDEDFALFSAQSCCTDDSVLTAATAEALLESDDYAAAYRRFGRRHPRAGYGGNFIHWIFEDAAGPYNSWGNGSAMRVSPVGWWFDSLEATLDEAARSAAVTHNHPEGIKGAQAVAAAIFLARYGSSKDEIRRQLSTRFAYDLDRRASDIRRSYRFDVSCQGSVPEALICFLDATDFEEAIRLAVRLGGDADTQACIAGSIAEAFFGGLPEEIEQATLHQLPPDLKKVVERFRAAQILA